MSGKHLQGLFADLAEHWEIFRVDELFDIQQGKQVSKATRAGNNQRPFLRTKNVYWARLDLTELDSMHFTIEEETRLALSKGDLLVCEGGWVGRTALWGDEIESCYYQNHLHRLRRKTDDILPEFALHWFWFAFEFGGIYFGRKNDTTIPNLSKSRLGELLMPRPSTDEQAYIAATVSAIWDQARERQQQADLYAELKDAVTADLMTAAKRFRGARPPAIRKAAEMA